MSDASDDFIDMMKRAGIPVTRQNYIEAAWGEQRPDWTAEHEMQLPEELQDWSLFEVKDGELVPKKQP
jgi:hypothetical protein